MPNTLAHIGLQFPLTRALVPHADPRWIALGLLIPDLPWILQRILHAMPLGIEPAMVRAYALIQVSPLCCALLCGAIALVYCSSIRIFVILFSNCLLHLLLDAAEEKGGVGVPFLIPFQWDCYAFPVLEMDGAVVTLLTIFGVLLTIYLCLRSDRFPGLGTLVLSFNKRTCIAAALLLLYTLLPALLSQNAIRANMHDTGIWLGQVQATGMTVTFDRAHFTPGEPGVLNYSVASHPVFVYGVDHSEQALISGTGRFLDDESIIMESWSVHPLHQRFSYSMAGLFAVGLIWLAPIIRSRKTQQPVTEGNQGPNTTR